MIAGVGERLGPYVSPAPCAQRPLPPPERVPNEFMDDLPEL